MSGIFHVTPSTRPRAVHTRRFVSPIVWPRDNGDTLFNSHSKSGPATQKTGVTHARLDASSGVSRDAQLADIFRYNVLSGVWKRGHRLDNFETLAAQHQVARLVQEGILSSRRAKSAVVLGGVARRDNRGRADVGNRGPGDDFPVQMLLKTVVHELPEDSYAVGERLQTACGE